MVSSKIRNNKFVKGVKRFETMLHQDQHEACQMIERKVLTILWGKAGTGKTLVGVFSALKFLIDGEAQKIIITRPTVSDEEIGFLPGDLKEKMDPWLNPVYENIKNIVGKENLKVLLGEDIVQIKPLSFMRGQTFTNSCIIVDEAQNVTHKQMEMIVGRLGIKSKMIVCGDMRQKDLKNNKKSGLPFLINNTEKLHEVGNYELVYNHRNKLVDKILTLYKNHE